MNGQRNTTTGRRNHLGARVGEWHGRARWPDSMVAKARELYPQIGSYRRVAKALGVPLGTVADWLRGDTRWHGGQP